MVPHAHILAHEYAPSGIAYGYCRSVFDTQRFGVLLQFAQPIRQSAQPLDQQHRESPCDLVSITCADTYGFGMCCILLYEKIAHRDESGHFRL